MAPGALKGILLRRRVGFGWRLLPKGRPGRLEGLVCLVVRPTLIPWDRTPLLALTAGAWEV